MAHIKKRWLILGTFALAGAGYAAYTHRHWFYINDVTTGESADYPHLRSRVYYAEPGAALAAAGQAVGRLPGWRVVFEDVENDALEAEAETPFGGFLDDVTVYAIPLGHGQTRITIRSRSRVGQGDLGQNAAHIAILQKAMDERLTGDAAF